MPFKFRVTVGENILTGKADSIEIAKTEFESNSLTAAKHKATRFANESLRKIDYKLFGKYSPIFHTKWTHSGKRLIRKFCRQNCKLQIWLVSIDKDLNAL